MVLGQEIKARREALKLSQTDLARLAGVSQPVINDLESGKQRTTKRIAAIAAAPDGPHPASAKAKATAATRFI